MLLLSVSCSTEDWVAPDHQDLSKQQLGIHQQARMASSAVFSVSPNGVDDTDNILEAFADAKAAGAGSVVQLEEGEFIIGMIEIREFNGFFKGMGKDKTTITNLPDLPCEEAFLDNVLPALVKFVGGNMVISDFTFRIQDGDPCAYGEINASIYGDLTSVLSLNDYSALHVPAERSINATVDHVDFIAGYDEGNGTYGTLGNVALTLFSGMDVFLTDGYEPLSVGNVSVTNCTFKDGLTGPDFFGFDEKSEIIIEDNTISGGSQQIFIGAMYGSKVYIRNNHLKESTWADIYLADNEYPEWFYTDAVSVVPTQFFVEGNTIESIEEGVSLYLSNYLRTLDPAQENPARFYIKSNEIELAAGGTGILGWYNIGSRIIDNRFTGTGSVGILLDGDAASDTYATAVKVLGNDFSGAELADATVLLTEMTTACQVSGAKSEYVVDNGVDNKVTGAKVKQKALKINPALHKIKPKPHLNSN